MLLASQTSRGQRAHVKPQTNEPQFLWTAMQFQSSVSPFISRLMHGGFKAVDVNVLNKLGCHDKFNQLTVERETRDRTIALKLIFRRERFLHLKRG